MIAMPSLHGEVGGRRPPGGGRAATTVMGPGPHPTPLRGATLPARGRDEFTISYVLNLKCITSPSATTYSLPSSRNLPASRAPASPLCAT